MGSAILMASLAWCSSWFDLGLAVVRAAWAETKSVSWISKSTAGLIYDANLNYETDAPLFTTDLPVLPDCIVCTYCCKFDDFSIRRGCKC